MGFDIYVVISQIGERIAQERLYTAYVCPETRRAQQCELHEHLACVEDWKTSWWNGFGRHLLHPERFLWGEMAVAKLEVAKFSVMKKSCLELTINKLRDRFDYREVFIERGIQKLLSEQTERRRNRIVGPSRNLFSKMNGEEVVVRVDEEQVHEVDGGDGGPPQGQIEVEHNDATA